MLGESVQDVLVPPSGAVFSSCRRYRYVLSRVSDLILAKSACVFIGLNPSTADEFTDDPTIRRCRQFALGFGCGQLYMLNLFAFRATLPSVMKQEPNPVGDDNDRWIDRVASCAEIVVAAWGNGGEHMGRGAAVAKRIPNLKCLGVTKSRQPKHPLYLASSTELVDYKQ